MACIQPVRGVNNIISGVQDFWTALRGPRLLDSLTNHRERARLLRRPAPCPRSPHAKFNNCVFLVSSLLIVFNEIK